MLGPGNDGCFTARPYRAPSPGTLDSAIVLSNYRQLRVAHTFDVFET